MAAFSLSAAEGLPGWAQAALAGWPIGGPPALLALLLALDGSLIMTRFICCAALALGLALLIALPARADINISVDGSLSDWGVTPGADYTPYAGVSSWIEPAIGSNGYVGPGYGGQTFNVEAMYSTIANNYLCFAVITGLPPQGAYGWNNNLYQHFYPGDILIDFSPLYIPSSNPSVPTGNFDYAVETTTYGVNYEHGGIGSQGAGTLFSNVTPGLAQLMWDGVYYPVEIARDANHVALGTRVNVSTQFVYSY
jgi:hypothetical protein